jgi:ATP-dependent protease La (LON) substrate-binding domain/Yippee zinc-binding/DNA-binding /Mis18, centromere assembly
MSQDHGDATDIGEQSPDAAGAAVPQLARDHTYLPGTSHPLMSESMMNARKSRRSLASPGGAHVDVINADGDGCGRCMQVPILWVKNVVVFPGTVLPLRLHQDRWVEYLGPKIDASRRLGTDEEITIGVVTEVETELRRASQQRNSWMRTGIDRRRSEDVLNILQHFDLERLSQNEDDEEEEDDDETESDEMEDDAPIAANARRLADPPSNPLLGRVGTLVTITNTHETIADLGSSELWRQASGSSELAVTALGTGRFRVVQAVDDGRHHPNGVDHFNSEVRFYRVEEMWDEELPLPPIIPQGSLSMIPKFILKRMWPWKLASEIRDILVRVPGLNGLNNSGKEDPTSFSFWVSSNLPLKESEKLHLLKLESTLERLKYLKVKLVALEKKQSFVCCKACHTKISATSNLFTVGGADGTTGAYVNEHGVIHQTVTVREVCDGKLLYTGKPETKDSWFPGYSWTIAHCRYCFSHLGWRFQSISQAKVDCADADRPVRFWGLSGASVTTF